MLNPKTMKTLVCIVYWHPEPSYLNLGLVHNGINPIQPDLPRFRTARPEPHVRVSLARAPLVKMAGTHVSMAAQKGAIFFGISSPSRCLGTPAARRRRWTWKDSPSSAPASASPTRTRRGPSLGTPRASIVLVGFALVLCGFWVRLVWFFDCVVCDRIWASGGFGDGFFFFADNLKDLQRFLRRDDPRSREVFQQVCRWNAAALHLVPMIEFCQAEQKLVVNAGEFWLFCFYGWRKCLIEQFFFVLCLCWSYWVRGIILCCSESSGLFDDADWSRLW